MSGSFIPFDAIRSRVVGVLDAEVLPDGITPLYLVRNLLGRVSISVSDAVRANDAGRDALQRLAHALRDKLGLHGYSVEDAVLFVEPAMLETLAGTAGEIRPGVYWVDRLVTGRDWWTVDDPRSEGGPARCTLFSVKGGVGRSTSAAVLAWHLARCGEQVLVVDLDLESPGLSSAMLDARAQPKFGVTDWFVEELVGQGDHVAQQMTGVPAWAHDLDGGVRVVPAHGQDPGEYLAKLGRVYMDSDDDPWASRLKRLLERLEGDLDPTVVLLESRSGLHDIAAASVTDIDARVLLFAIDSNSTWTDYGILFRHWREHGLAGRIRDRLSIVSALTPELDTERYLQRFREKAWNLFRDGLYGDVEPSEDSGDPYTFDRDEEDAPHVPFAIHWTRGLAAGASLIALEATPVLQAYRDFLRRFDGLLMTGSGERE
jgi:hypothetical protein